MAPWVNFQPWQQTPATLGAGSLPWRLMYQNMLARIPSMVMKNPMSTEVFGHMA